MLQSKCLNLIGIGDNMGYLAYNLLNRAELIRKCSPKYPDINAHHITYKFPASSSEELPPEPKIVQVVGYSHAVGGLEALIVKIDNNIMRPDGGIFHITLSLDRS